MGTKLVLTQHILKPDADVTLCGLSGKNLHGYRLGCAAPQREWLKPCARCANALDAYRERRSQGAYR